MQEGVLALMQMAKTVAAVDELREAAVPYISVMAHPTTGGVAASFAALGDVTIAEPGALLSFSGPRVVKQTTGETPPDDFGLAESNLRHGHIDLVVPRPELRDTVARVVALLSGGAAVPAHAAPARPGRAAGGRPGALRGPAGDLQPQERSMTTTERRRFRFLRRRGADGESWHAVQLARHQDRPYTLDYLNRICDDFVELHGDRAEGDDPAIVAGIGSFRGRSVAFVGHQKGRDLKERTYRNFGMASPEGYRKAMRVFELAGRLGFPVVTLIDTPGAAPGVGAETRGQSGAIARSQLMLMSLPVPVVACVIGEGSSGGALAIGVADRVLMQQNAIYTVISPGGLRGDPLEGRRRGQAGRGGAAADRRGLPRPRRGRRGRRGAVRRRAPRPRQGGGAAGRRDLGGARLPGIAAGDRAAPPAPAEVLAHGCVRGVIAVPQAGTGNLRADSTHAPHRHPRGAGVPSCSHRRRRRRLCPVPASRSSRST